MHIFKKIFSQALITAIPIVFIPLIFISLKIYYSIASVSTHHNLDLVIAKSLQLILAVGLFYTVGIVILILCIYLLIKKYLGPLKKILPASRQLAAGNIPEKLRITYKDEIGELARSINHIRDRIQHSTIKLKNSYQREQASKKDAQNATSQKNDFLYKVSTELKTPLTPILSYSNLIIASINEGKYDKELDEKIRIIRDCADNILNITSNINEFSRLQTERIRVKNSNFETVPFIEELIKLHHFSAEHNSIKLKCIYSEGYPNELYTDKEVLFHILSNIISYAVKYSTKGSDIIISVEQKHNEVLFVIQDSTAGTQGDVISHIFELSSERIMEATHYLSNAKLFGLVSAIANTELIDGKLETEIVANRGTAFKLSIKNKTESDKDIIIPTFNI